MKKSLLFATLTLLLAACSQFADTPGPRLEPTSSLSTGETARVSVDDSSNEGNGFSDGPSISADGRYVAFRSAADNLASDDHNGMLDVFVRDLDGGTTERVSVDSNGNEGNGHSIWTSISADGRYVAFQSTSDNLVAGDANETWDVFVRDLDGGTTERVSVANNGEGANAISFSPSISADGRYVAFQSTSDDLAAGDVNETWDVFVRDLEGGTTERVSVASNGDAANASSTEPSISADGRYVAFTSHADNLVKDDLNRRIDVFVRDRVGGTTERVSVVTDGNEGGSRSSSRPSISADGRYVAFESHADDLVVGDSNVLKDVFVHDRGSGTTERVSVDSNGNQATGGHSAWPTISADGRYVAFHSYAVDLAPEDTNGAADVILHDRDDGTTQRVSIASTGTEANGPSTEAAISADGGYVAFESGATNLVSGDSNGLVDVFVHRQATDAASNAIPTADAGGTYGGDEGSAIPLGGATASDPDSDPLSLSWTVDEGRSCSFDDATVLAPKLTCSDDGAFAVTLTVDDGVSPPVSDVATVHVLNVAPTVSGITTSATDAENPVVEVNTSIDVIVTFRDPAGRNDEPYTCAFDFENDSVIDETVANVTGSTCTGTFAYEEAGAYEVAVTVTDHDADASAPALFEYIVVYDPSVGFVTGVGWIHSEAGACKEPDICAATDEGEANFGFVSKYKRGASVPSGVTRFRFHAGNLRFRSKVQEWLVISKNDSTAQFKGSGTINGHNDGNGQPYKFMLWAGDGEPDTVRIKIWSEDDGMEDLVYDNGSPRPVAGGSVNVHTE